MPGPEAFANGPLGALHPGADPVRWRKIGHRGTAGAFQVRVLTHEGIWDGNGFECLGTQVDRCWPHSSHLRNKWGFWGSAVHAEVALGVYHSFGVWGGPPRSANLGGGARFGGPAVEQTSSTVRASVALQPCRPRLVATPSLLPARDQVPAAGPHSQQPSITGSMSGLVIRVR